MNVWDVELQSTLYVNRARAHSLVGDHQLAAQDLSLAISLWDHEPEHSERREKCMKAYYLRAKTRCARQKYESARQDVEACITLNVPDSAPMLQQLSAQIDREQKDVVRSNKVLAKEISKWADGAFGNM